LARLVLAATREPTPALSTDSHTIAFLIRRLGTVEEVLRGGRRPQELLATPNYPDGWVAPSNLVERLQAATSPPDPYDLTAALLRLHPEDRLVALNRARDERGALIGRVADTVRYALGGEPPPPERRRSLRRSSKLAESPLWVAASRARAPLDQDEWLAVQGVAGAGRSCPIDAAVDFRSEPYTWTDQRGAHKAIHWRWTINLAAANTRVIADEPTASAWAEHDRMMRQSAEDFIGWLAVIWPHDAEHFLLTGLDAVLDVATHDEVRHDAVRVIRAIARHPGRLGSLALTALAAGLTASKADQRALSVDAVLQLHRVGRLTAPHLASGMTSIAGPATLTGWATTLRDLASAGPADRRLVVDALGATLPALDHNSRGLHALLELLREELLRDARPTPPGLLPWLGRLSGSSRTHKAAAALRALA
jgi:hypothetical protein